MHRPHRNLDGKGSKKCQPQPFLQIGGEQLAVSQRVFDVRRPGLEIDGEDGEQHQHRAEQCVEKKLESRIDPVRAAPHPNDQEHWDQHPFEEHIKQDEIERANSATIW